METMPMFPLNLVAMPGAVIPLRLFEPRYLALHRTLLEDPQFGIVLIERGTAEAGGSDSRFAVGTAVEAKASTTMDDGSVLLIASGQDRIRVVEWMEPDPYPMATVERLDPHRTDEHTGDIVRRCREAFAEIVEIVSTLGEDQNDEPIVVPREPIAAVYAMAEIAPLQDLDRQRILEAPDATAAARALLDGLTGVVDILTFEFGPGSG